MWEGISVALRPVICEDIGRMIQNMVYQDAMRDRKEKFVKIHNELLSIFMLEEGGTIYGEIDEL